VLAVVCVMPVAVVVVTVGTRAFTGHVNDAFAVLLAESVT
jgi:hypothetical protein